MNDVYNFPLYSNVLVKFLNATTPSILH